MLWSRAMTPPYALYSQLAAIRLKDEAAIADWTQRVEQLSTPDWATNFASCGRRLGTQQVVLTENERQKLELAALPLPEGWPLAMLGRVALLLSAGAHLPLAKHKQLLSRLYRTSDSAERVALLKALPLLPEPERFAELAIDACRSHVQDVFEAIACENAYPAAFFPNANFYQLVLKAFFTEVETSRIVNLPRRRSPELSRMAQGYASERRAAGRSVPSDLNYVLGSDSKSPPR